MKRFTQYRDIVPLDFRPAIALFIATAMLCLATAAEAGSFDHFISRNGSGLYNGDKPFRFISINIPNYFIIEDRAGKTGEKWHRVTAFEQRDAANAVKRLGGQVFRAYTFSVAGGRNLAKGLAHIYADEAGQIRYHEELFKDVDRGLAIAAEQGVRVIIPLVDNWEWFGGHAEWARLSGVSDFWNDPKAKADFKAFITWLMNRKNTVTGVVYKDDPTIMAWELGNEIDKASPDWIMEMAAHIKGIDSNHLLIDGGHKEVPAVALADKNIDIVTTHYTDKQFTDFAEKAAWAGKAYIYGEFNPSDSEVVGDILRRTVYSPAAGAMAWSLRFRTEKGGFYYHYDFNGNSDSLHYPGFPSTRPVEEEEVMRILREGALYIQGAEIDADPAPGAPTLLPFDSPTAISWQGSSGATSYNVQRRKGSGDWETVATGVSDAVPVVQGGEIVAKLPLFSDQPGHGSWSYRVIAVNDSGASPPSNVIQVKISKK